MSRSEIVSTIAHILEPWAFETTSWNATVARNDAMAKAEQIADALATTPGGDLREQAARGKVELLFDQAFADGIAAGKSGDDSILAGSSSAYAQAAIRALKPAGDGGEA